jgi:hypothetical protein
MRRLGLACLLPLLALTLVACDPRAAGRGNPFRGLRLNDIQVLSSHNSYHVEPEPVLFEALHAFLGDPANGFQYTHQPLEDELELGVRHVELDVFVDTPQGGLYAAPQLGPVLGLEPVDPRMSEPGLKVLHVQEVDYRSTCPTLVSCLEDIQAWSDANPDHVPVVIQLEPKDDVIPDPLELGFVTPIDWDGPAFAQLEAEIRSVFPPERIITPGDVIGDFPTLREAVEQNQWPKLKKAKGKVMFTLDDTGEEREAYRSQVPEVAERLVFVAAQPPDPDAAVVVVNDPIGGADRIRDLVQRGYLVRTRADADTVQARTGDTTRRDAAWASGAHFVSTDYVVPDDRFPTDYSVTLPDGGEWRCNPFRTCPRFGRDDA